MAAPPPSYLCNMECRYNLYPGHTFEEILTGLLNREPVGEAAKGCAVLAEMNDGDSLLSETLARAAATVQSGGTSLVYGDWIEQTVDGWVARPTIDCSEGALRDDFDFGRVVVVSERLLNDFLATVAAGAEGSLFYALALYARRWGSIVRMAEPLLRKIAAEVLPGRGIEAQFEYVMAEQRRRQEVREGLCREHLRAVGACIAPPVVVKEKGEEPVTASVIIPVFNRASTIGDAIGSALSQQTDFAYNVIVVNNFSTDGTGQVIEALAKDDSRVVCLRPPGAGYGIGGCWQLAIDNESCGRYAVQLDSDDLYAHTGVLQMIVDKFRSTGAAAVIGSYKLVDFDLNPLPGGVIDHKEWSAENGANNALRINGFGAPRAFARDVVRRVGFPNVSYGEDYAVCLRLSAEYKVERIYDVLYLCRRWGGNSDSKLSRERQNTNNAYKDSVRTRELLRRKKQVRQQAGMTVSQEEMKTFFDAQLQAWPEVAQRVEQIDKVQTKRLLTPHSSLLTQFNPARIRSTGAKVDKQSISERPCFLCHENQPAEQWRTAASDDLWLCINPYPILRYHLTLPTREHRRQELRPMLTSMLRLAEAWPDMIVFYNGPGCGASAPDHAHLQAGLGTSVPLRRDFRHLQSSLVPIEPCTREEETGLYLLEDYATPLIVAKARSLQEAEQLTQKTIAALPVRGDEWEPRMNVIAWTEMRSPHATEWIVCIIPREKLRPECYFKQGHEQRVISPGALDMAGLIITPRADDFEMLTATEAVEILKEVSLPRPSLAQVMRRLRGYEESTSNPVLNVGIVEAERVNVEISGEQIEINNNRGRVEVGGKQYLSFLLEPEGTWTIQNVVIGKQFHWQRSEQQTFEGALWVVPRGRKLQVINRVRLETYLRSVIASEMKATASLEYLKASAIVSRSWLLAQLGSILPAPSKSLLNYTDSSAHLLYDVCADDHCQRYQGVVRAQNPNVDKAMESTRGLVLVSDGKVCDARFSKCCGGRTEEFSACWQDINLSYLRSLPDGCECGELDSEEAMRQWVMSNPAACCNTNDQTILRQVLNDYDLETRNFFRWQVEIPQGKLQELLRSKLGLDLGAIKALIPLKRGRGGRLSRLKIVGTRGEQVIGKELAIRRALSETHLLSAAFIVEAVEPRDGIPQAFLLRGAGWGHGVGMCQIGAARMASEGATCDEILHHYFGPGVEIKQL